MANYVKFMRGTPKAFEMLRIKDNDTLYFISEADADHGKLYLGAKEIICDNGNSAEAVSYLKDLLDVDLPEDVSELKDGQVLTYDANTSKWVARDVGETASVVFDANQFILNENGELSIVNFANAEVGAQLTKSENGSLIWVKPNEDTVEELGIALDELRSDLSDLDDKVAALDTPEQVNSKISEAIAAANHLSYKIVETLDEIALDAADADKYIYLVKNGNIYDEYMVVNGALEQVGDWSVDLSKYATKEEVDTAVEDLTGILNGLSSDVTDLTDELNRVKTLANENKTAIEDLTLLLNNKVDVDVYNSKMEKVDSDIADLYAVMTWNQLEEPTE